MKLVEVNHISKEYEAGEEKVLAVNDISFDFTNNEFIAIMGESGSGKSTLLTIIGGLCKPTSGKVVVDGIDIYSLPQNKLADFRKEYLGFVFQAFQLVPYLTVEENVMLPLAITELSKKLKKEIVYFLLEKVHLKDKSKRLINELSGGEQQRVAIARALVNDPLIILADEPTGNLDSKTSEEIINIFQSLVSENKTVVMVTHNKEYVKYVNRVIKLSDGKIISEENVQLSVMTNSMDFFL